MEAKQQQRKLTHLDFAKFLMMLDPESPAAAAKYETLRLKLTSFFRWHGVPDAEEYADETIDRMLERISDGAAIVSLNGYAFATARNMLRERSELQKKIKRAFSDPCLRTDHTDPYEEAEQRKRMEDDEQRMRCLGICLKQLTHEERRLILRYYQHEKHAKISRRKISDKLGIQQNALRIRVHRIRMKLSKLVYDCMSGQSTLWIRTVSGKEK
jgi:RNA polymerase sigma factor (sigma-70 family)